ncbi:hypothetical protein [Paracoccus mutanolyticus]|uniref:hypothetical protein n=1 Tax=Paracoccus mutanolyticus TaxID=1499308 RepID=UPI001CB96A1D|nr:hypothetical protein [Paracoccus mutanolyticus]
MGPATACAARAAGFDVTEGPGDAAGMMPMLEGLGPGWLHPHGAHVARELPVPGMVVYDQRAQAPTPQALKLLAGAGPVILPLFSPRTARLAAAMARDARAPLWVAPISAAAAAAFDAPSARQALAPTPDGAGIRAALARLLAPEQSC